MDPDGRTGDTFAYDLWGDTANVASRLESDGEPGRILPARFLLGRAEANAGS